MRIRFVLYRSEFEVDLPLPLIPSVGHFIHPEWLFSLIGSQYDTEELPVKEVFLSSRFPVSDVTWKSNHEGVYVEVEINDSEYYANF